MHWQFNPYILPLIIAFILGIGLAAYSWPHRQKPGVLHFLFLVTLAGEWSLTYALEMLAVSLPDKVFWAKVQYLSISFISVAWLFFTFDVTGRTITRKPRFLIPLLQVPLATVILAWTTEWHGLMYRSVYLQQWGPYTILRQNYGPWFWVIIGYSYLMTLVGTVRLLQWFNWKHSLYRGQGASLLAGVILPWLGNLGYLFKIAPIPNYDWTPVLFSFSGLMLYFAILRYKFLDLVPFARAALIQNMRDGMIVLDNQERILDLNQSAYRFVDDPKGRILGEKVHLACPVLGAPLENLTQQGASSVEVTTGEQDEQRVYELESTPLYSNDVFPDGRKSTEIMGRLLQLRDVTEHKQAESELRRSEESYRGLFNSAMEAVFIHDAQGRFLDVNQGAVEMYGFSHSFFIGKTPEILAAPGRNDLADLQNRIARAFAGEAQRFEFWGRRSTGQEFPKEVRLYKGKYFGEDVVIAFAIDITERKKAEQSMLDYNLELERRVHQRTTDLEMAYKELETFAYSISHDLRAPLRSIDAYARVLSEDYHTRLDESGLAHLGSIHQDVVRMGSLIDDLLSLARYTNADLSFSQVNLSKLAEEIVVELRQFDPERQVEVTIQPELIVAGDAPLLRVLLQNLIGNAWKFTRLQPLARIDIGARQEKDHKVHFVQDNGVGFDMSYVGKLFIPFQRLHQRLEFEGRGIGLAMAQRIVRRHGGDIWAYSEPGKGATFFFYLEDMRLD